MISYSRNLFTGPILSHLEGDKLLLPSFVLEEILRAGSGTGSESNGFATATYNSDSSDFSNTHLPYPIVFQIFNPKTRLITHGGVKEFNSADKKAYLPSWMYDSLSLKEGEEVTIRLKELPKGNWARFRPMTMDYKDIMDYRAAFEAYLRSYYTTLTTGEILTIKQADNSYQFIVDSLKPANAVQIVDTDLEVEIIPFIEDLTINQNQDQDQDQNGLQKLDNKKKNLIEKEITAIGKPYSGSVSSQDYEYWILNLNDKSYGLNIEMIYNDGDADLIVSNERYPKVNDHLWSDFSSPSSTSTTNKKSIIIPPTNHEYSISDKLYIGIYGFSESTTSYELMVTLLDPITTTTATAPSSSLSSTEINNKVQCKNCDQWIPSQTITLHTNFCERNNTKCNLCGKVIKKGLEEQHWHCDKCDKNGDLLEKDKHELIFHTLHKCSCKFETESLQDLAMHKRTTCPDRLITCKFCRNLIKQDEPSTNPQDLLEGLTIHESYCGARTIKCMKCGESVTLRNVRAHANMHEIEKQNRKLPKLCRNENCIRPVANNALKLCLTCFGPFWSPTSDPTGRMLYTRLGRKYHQQLTIGCGNSWCKNMYCATGNSTKKDPNTAASTILPHLRQIQLSPSTTPIYLCVDELTTRRRFLADILYKGKDLVDGGSDGEFYEKYPIEFCVKAVEIENDDLVEARKWLQANAPSIVKEIR